jgi:phosphoglycerol transferase
VAFFTGLLIFRATNRFSIFLSALVLLWLASRLTRLFSAWPAWMSVGAAAVVAAIGLVDQLPPAPGLEKQRRIAERIESDREIARLLEGRLAPGSMVFQLPVVSFPESPPTHQLGDYEHFRPFLATDSLRFSYGVLRGRTRGRWQRDAETLPTEEFVQKIERYGFAAVHIRRSGFPDRGEKLLGELAAMGRTERIDGRQGEQVVVLLKPAADPKLPFARTLTFGKGWHSSAPGQPRWAYGPASLTYFNPQPAARSFWLRLKMSAVDERTVSLQINGGETQQLSLHPEPLVVELPVTLEPGFNRLDFTSGAPAVRLSSGRNQLRAFAVHETAVRAESP